jgi:hypothetical protein
MTEDEKNEFELWKASKNNITKIEVQADKIEPLPKKEKKPRTDKQIEATKKMREALLNRRKEHNNKKTEHTEQYKMKMLEAEEKADKIRELNPNAKVIVKSRIGRPRGVKNPPVDPTPYQSDNDDDEAEMIPPRNKTLKPRESQLIVNKPNISAMEMWLRKLNGR